MNKVLLTTTYPKGAGLNFISGEEYEGNRWVSETMDFFSVPLMMRQGSTLVTKGVDNQNEYDESDEFELNIYRLPEVYQETKYISFDGKLNAKKISINKVGKSLTIKTDISELKLYDMQTKEMYDIFGKETIIELRFKE